MEKLTPLCKIAYKYGTDKCPQIGHKYTPIYYNLFKNRRKKIRKVLELGIGSRKTLQWVPPRYQKGASLKMWRDFFPNAQIYGADIDLSTVFRAKRITTFLIDLRDRTNLVSLIKKIGEDVDLVIDDASHHIIHQLLSARILLHYLKKGCIYIIEDATLPDQIKNRLKNYDCRVITFGVHDKPEALVIIRKKQ